MSKTNIPVDNAIAIRRDKGIQVTFDNQSANDIYLSYNRAQLDQSAVAAVPDGIKVTAGTRVQLYPFLGLIWARAAVAATIIVEP